MKKKMFIIIGLLVLVISVLLLISYIGNKKKISNIETLNDAMEQNNIKETNTIAEIKPEENDIPYNQVENVIQENTIDEKTETLRNNMEAKENIQKKIPVTQHLQQMETVMKVNLQPHQQVIHQLLLQILIVKNLHKL